MSLASGAVARYGKMFSAAFFPQRAAGFAHREYTVWPGFETFTLDTGNLLKSVSYSEALPQKLSGNFLQIMYSAFLGKDELQAEASRAL